ncbi:acyl-CoA dehydrogenase family protein [Sphingobium sp. V4]|uniref:acyl-CoA dehydrogenase family protein n=1 Tax=Sphingobium sp. V4 TaxID=3038927 RepID=UPI002557DDE8|nr:acyl-CoA dehydrogenase family protein [Sphingobium sp. V4]WIW89450.1 acyl-CoA dehydrogenase family protein [Sphingobium sp. V4]
MAVTTFARPGPKIFCNGRMNNGTSIERKGNEMALTEEQEMIVDLVRKFVASELLPLEPAVLAREAEGNHWSLLPEESEHLIARAKDLGLWGLDAPEEFGGYNLPATVMARVQEELGRTMVPFTFPPDSPNLVMLARHGTEKQKQKYLTPYIEGKTVSAICISEPGAGGDPAMMTTKAVQDGDDFVLNGRKIWISRAPIADFTIAMARVGDGKRHEGITAFIIDKDTPGYIVEREIKMLGGFRTYEVVLEDCRVPATQVLGSVGKGFAAMQDRLVSRRIEMVAISIGMADRALKMLIEHAKERITFGQALADRQAVQWWIADGYTKIHACRLMLEDAAAKADRGEDVRTEASMLKIVATELAQEVIDNAIQAFGALGLTKDLPLQLMYQRARVMRIYEGPSEVHRMTLAKRLLK